MNNLTLQQKIVYPILGAFAIVIAIGSWYFVSAQIAETELRYREELRTLVTASGFTVHSSVAKFALSKGLQFHKVRVSESYSGDGSDEIETRAIEAFKRNPNLDLFVEEVPMKDDVFLTVFESFHFKPECNSCHTKFDVDPGFGGKDGNLPVLFGISRSMAEIHAKETRAKTIVLLFTVAVIAALGWIVHRSMKVILLEPLGELKLQAEDVATCNLRIVKTPALEHKLASGDEMGHVARSFETMIRMLRTAIRNLHNASNEIADASNKISSSIEEIAAGSEEQTSQANEVANAIEEMTGTIMENSRSAHEAAEIARRARQMAEKGGIIVMATGEGMKRIAQATSRSSQIAQALERSSSQIGEIVKLINEIADQSSLLALNAAIEAARAGEHGRGFSIVADEIRKLADRTTNATKGIDVMIKNIQRETREAVASMDDGTQEVNKGMNLADQARQSLREIEDISQKVTDKITQIAASSEQQSATSEQISQNVESINSVTKQTAGSTREVASASEGLRQLTVQLQNSVNEFKFDKDEEKKDKQNFEIVQKRLL